MQSIAEQLLKQKLVTAEQAEKADGNRGDGSKTRRARRSSKPKKPSIDPKIAAARTAIEDHRVTEDFSGDIKFVFVHRNRKKGEMMVNIPTAARLGSGELAIVEHKDEHVIVAKEAIVAIREADPEAIRYHAG